MDFEGDERPKIDVEWDALIRHTELIIDYIKDKDKKNAVDMSKHLIRAMKIYQMFNSK